MNMEQNKNSIWVEKGSTFSGSDMTAMLEYIAESPNHKDGGFHPYAVEAAKDALATITRLTAANKALVEALKPLADIAAEFDANGLDEARPDWGDNERNAKDKELFSGRGGKSLLCLHHAFTARTALAAQTTQDKGTM